MIHNPLRVSYLPHPIIAPLNSPGAVYRFLIEIWDNDLIELQEQTYAIYLNNINQVIGWRGLTTCTMTDGVFDIKFALCIGISCMACKIIIAHNHPSGDLKPSPEDIKMTNNLRAACIMVDMKLTDHLIISKSGFYSFKDHDLP